MEAEIVADEFNFQKIQLLVINFMIIETLPPHFSENSLGYLQFMNPSRNRGYYENSDNGTLLMQIFRKISMEIADYPSFSMNNCRKSVKKQKIHDQSSIYSFSIIEKMLINGQHHYLFNKFSEI
ncbi:MAG: hypothetical protein U5K72_16065 [Balneolaceae bacterium]|nr:hypothetical protein [Balneolaceae bacterium]